MLGMLSLLCCERRRRLHSIVPAHTLTDAEMSFAARRAKPRKIAARADGDDDDGDDDNDNDGAPAVVVVRRPPKSGTTTTKTAAAAAAVTRKIPAPARLSFGFGGSGDAAEEGGDSGGGGTTVFVPKKSALSRQAMERNAAKKKEHKKKPPMGVGMERLAIAPEPERVSYSKEYLAELRSAQLPPPPPTPDAQQGEEGEEVGDDGADGHGGDDGDDTAMAVMVDRGGGGTQIMDEGVVRVMKARRAERAAAAKAGVDDFISLDVSADDHGSELVLRPTNKKKKESRLAQPDGDDAEEIANYVDDAERVLLLPSTGKAARRQHERRRKQAIADTIAEAEAEAGGGGGGGDDGDGGSDVSRDSLVEGFERDQIRKGAFAAAGELAGGRRGAEAELDALARNPPAAQALPPIGSVVARLEARLHEVEMHKKLAERQIEMLLREKREIREHEDAVQARLKEAGDKYEQLRQDAGHAAAADALAPAGDRGLESFGNTPIRVED